MTKRQLENACTQMDDRGQDGCYEQWRGVNLTIKATCVWFSNTSAKHNLFDSGFMCPCVRASVRLCALVKLSLFAHAPKITMVNSVIETELWRLRRNTIFVFIILTTKGIGSF